MPKKVGKMSSYILYILTPIHSLLLLSMSVFLISVSLSSLLSVCSLLPFTPLFHTTLSLLFLDLTSLFSFLNLQWLIGTYFLHLSNSTVERGPNAFKETEIEQNCAFLCRFEVFCLFVCLFV